MSTSFNGIHHFPSLGDIQQRTWVPPNSLPSTQRSSSKAAPNAQPLSQLTGFAEETFKIFYSMLTGKTIALVVGPQTKVSELKAQIATLERIPLEQIRVVFGNRLLLDSKILKHYDVVARCTLHEECVDLPALIEFYNALNGEDWLSTARSKSNRHIWDIDQNEITTRAGECELVTHPDTNLKRFVHSSLQASFDRQSEPSCRHFVSPTTWPKAEAQESDYEIPGKLKLRRDTWQVVKLKPVLLKDGGKSNKKKHGKGKKGKKGDAAEAKPGSDSGSGDKGKKKKSDKGNTKKDKKTAEGGGGGGGATETADAKRKKPPKGADAEDLEEGGEKGGDRAGEDDEDEEESSSALSGGAVTDPDVDHHTPSNWFGVTTAPSTGQGLGQGSGASSGASSGARNEEEEEGGGGGGEGAQTGSVQRQQQQQQQQPVLRVTELRLSRNGLKGHLPFAVLGRLQGLRVLDLSMQTFTSVRPPENERRVASVPLVPSGGLRGWIVPGRKRAGELAGEAGEKVGPEEEEESTSFAGLPHLKHIDLSTNNLSGPLPGWPGSAFSLAGINTTVMAKNRFMSMKARRESAEAVAAAAKVAAAEAAVWDKEKSLRLSLTGRDALEGGEEGSRAAAGKDVAAAAGGGSKAPESSVAGVGSDGNETTTTTADDGPTEEGPVEPSSSLPAAAGPPPPSSPQGPEEASSSSSSSSAAASRADSMLSPPPPPPLGWQCSGGLHTLCLNHNRFTGNLPTGLSELKQLKCLKLDHNLLTGPLSSTLLAGWPRLQVLRLGSNKLSGPLPRTLNETNPNLEVLSLEDNLFTGPLPGLGLSGCLRLEALSLSRNALLTGPVPVAEWVTPVPCPDCCGGGGNNDEDHNQQRRCDNGVDDDDNDDNDRGDDSKERGAFVAETTATTSKRTRRRRSKKTAQGQGSVCLGCAGRRAVVPFRRLLVLGLEYLVRVTQRPSSCASLRAAFEAARSCAGGPPCRVYVEPMLPEHSVEWHDEKDALAKAGKQGKEDAEFAKTKALKEAAASVYDNVGGGGVNHDDEKSHEETSEELLLRKALELSEKESLKAAQEALERSQDSDTVKEWRVQSEAKEDSKEDSKEDDDDDGNDGRSEAASFQLAMAYEMGLFGLEQNLGKALKYYKLAAPDPDGRRAGGSAVAAAEVKRLEQEELDRASSGAPAGGKKIKGSGLKQGEVDDEGQLGKQPQSKNRLQYVESDATEEKEKFSSEGPYMSTYSGSVYSVLLEGSYTRSR